MIAAVDTTEITLAPPMQALVEQGILTPTAFHVSAVVTLTERSEEDDLTTVPEFLQWVAIGHWLGAISTAVKWWIGDWLAFGEGAWGERYAQAAEATGLDIGTLQNYAYTCRQVMPSRRRPELSFTSHYVVAKLEPRDQDDWLAYATRKQAETNGAPGVRFGSRELRQAIKQAGGRVPGERHEDGREPTSQTRHEPLIDAEKVVKAAQRVWKTAQPDGDAYKVTREAFQALALALGKGD